MAIYLVSTVPSPSLVIVVRQKCVDDLARLCAVNLDTTNQAQSYKQSLRTILRSLGEAEANM